MLKGVIGLVLACVVPLSVTSRTFLRQQLAYNGVPPSLLSRECLRELAEHSVKLATLIARFSKQPLRSVVAIQIDSDAEEIAAILHSVPAAGRADYRAVLADIMQKHGVMASHKAQRRQD